MSAGRPSGQWLVLSLPSMQQSLELQSAAPESADDVPACIGLSLADGTTRFAAIAYPPTAAVPTLQLILAVTLDHLEGLHDDV